MPQVKGIELAEFKYPYQGGYESATWVILQAPGLRQYGVHNRMTAYIMQAFRSMKKDNLIDDPSPDDPINPTADQSEDDNSDQIMGMLAFGLANEPQAYEKLCNDVRSLLTNNPTLCRIEGTNAPISDEAWEHIADTNGLNGINRILSVFVSFFMDQTATPSQSANGPDRSTTYASPTTERSMLGTPPRVHNAN